MAAIAFNTYREAIRGKILYGLLVSSVASLAYALLVATLSLQDELRVLVDLGIASMSLASILGAIVIGSSSLYREIDLKTLFPLLTRTLTRQEYIASKFVGTLLVLAVFVMLHASLLLALLTFLTCSILFPASALALLGLHALLLASRPMHTRLLALLPWVLAFFFSTILLASEVPHERQIVLLAAWLTFCEGAIVAAMATFFASFSTPFLTALFTFALVLIGRSMDTLANLPEKIFGSALRAFGQICARILPNLNAYTPPRTLLLGEGFEISIPHFVGMATLHALAFCALLGTLGAFLFARRDLT